MSNLNDVKAGKYQLVAQSWEHITSKPSEPLDFTRYKRGDVVDLNVEDAKRLVAAGAVVEPGALERSAVERAKAAAAEAQRAYEAALSGLPEDVRAEVAPGTVSAVPSTEAASDPEDQLDISKNVEDVVSWVNEGGSAEDVEARAAEALEAERGKAKPRPTLLETLEALLKPAS